MLRSKKLEEAASSYQFRLPAQELGRCFSCLHIDTLRFEHVADCQLLRIAVGNPKTSVCLAYRVARTEKLYIKVSETGQPVGLVSTNEVYVYPKAIPWEAVTALNEPLIPEDQSFGVMLVYVTREAYNKDYPDTPPLVLRVPNENANEV